MKSNHVFSSLLFVVLGIGGAGGANAAPYILAPNTQGGTVSVIDAASNTIATTIPVAAAGLLGVAVAPDGAFAYVGGFAGTVWVIDTAAGVVTDAIPVGAGPRGFAFTRDGALAYVVDQFADVVWVIDTASKAVVDSTDLPSVGFPHGYSSIAIALDDSRVYVGDTLGNLSIVDPSANDVVARISLAGGVGGMALSPDGARAYVANNANVSVVSTSSTMVTGTIRTFRSPVGIAITQDGRLAYVSNSDGYARGSVSIIDLSTNRVVGSPIPVGVFPAGLVISPDQKFVYVANQCGDGCVSPYHGSVSVIETATNTVVASIPVGKHPGVLAVAPTLTVVPAPECADGLDNDGDGAADWADEQPDPGCDSPADESERSAALVCDDGIDNDSDGLADYPDDPNCVGPADPSENPVACDDGLDNDDDGLIDHSADPSCTDSNDASELGEAACDNGIDDDGDGLVDSRSDPGCASAVSAHESCDANASATVDRNDIQAIVDGIGETAAAGDPRDADNDGTLTIFDSAACANQCTYVECQACGLLGIEPVLVLVALRALRSRRTARRKR